MNVTCTCAVIDVHNGCPFLNLYLEYWFGELLFVHNGPALNIFCYSGICSCESHRSYQMLLGN